MESADAAGNHTGGVWTAGLPDAWASLTVTQGSTYSSSAAFALPTALSNGTYRLWFQGWNGYNAPNYAANLFFDTVVPGDGPNITITQVAGVTSSGTGFQQSYAGGATSHGSLSYDNGVTTATASNFQLYDPVNAIVGFDLTVADSTGGTATPEPGTIGMMLAGFGLLGVRFVRRRA